MLPSAHKPADELEPLELLASAIAARELKVAAGKSGEPSWTDGQLVYVDAGVTPREQLQAVIVQAALIAAGSLQPELLARLIRRPTLAQRYLTLEGHRALASIEAWLPFSALSLIDRTVALRSTSPEQSLSVASGREPISSPPPAFGTLRARRLLKRARRIAPTVAHVPDPRDELKREPQILDEAQTDADGGLGDAFSVAGGAGLLGRLFQHLLHAARQAAGGGGPLGGSPATHRLRTAPRHSNGGVYSSARTDADETESATKHGLSYPEWDTDLHCYRANWCTVQELESPVAADGAQMILERYGLRRQLARLGLGLDRHHRQPQGDDIDLDAVIEARVHGIGGQIASDALYVDSLRRRRDLSVLLLLDISGSVGQTAMASERTVHQQQRATAAAFTVALHELGDRVALYAFRSQGRSAVHLLPVKRFRDGIGSEFLRRLESLEAGAYSRLGAAVRHGTSVLAAEGGTSRQLLIVLSDGLAYDHRYEPAYGAADARQALAEARRRGIGCLCLSIGASTDTNDLQRVFGTAAHASFVTPERVGLRIGPLLLAAIRAAEVRRTF